MCRTQTLRESVLRHPTVSGPSRHLLPTLGGRALIS